MSGKWVPCGKKSAQDTAHIIRRNQCGKVWDHPDVAMLGCRQCHNNFDDNVLEGDAIYQVRVPYEMAKFAWDLVVANTKVKPYARYNPDVNPDYSDVIIGRGLTA